MLKNYIYLSLFIIIFANKAFALNSSSYLIANTAVNLFDFEEAYQQYNSSEKELGKYDSYNKLITLVNLKLIEKANEVARDILEIDKVNSEAWLVILTYAKIKNDYETFDEYKKLKNFLQKKLFDYIFFEQNYDFKSNELAANAIFEIIQASIANESRQDDFKFLLFYLSIAEILDSNIEEINYYTAYIYQTLKNYSKAEHYYRKIGDKHKLYIDSQKSIAINKNKSGLFEEGEEILLNLIKKFNNNNELLLALADLYRIDKKYDQAIEYYTKVINFEPSFDNDYWRIYYLRGICFERSNQWNMAEKDFLYSLELNSSSPNVLNYLAYGWLERDENIDLALEMLIDAYKAYPESYYILDSLAWAYYKKKQLVKAVELMEKVIEMAPSEAISLDHLADIYFALKRKREAIFFWKQALDLAMPEDMISENLIKKLEKYNAG